MTSSLRKQLAALQSVPYSSKKRASILYDEKEAADIGLDQLYKNAKLAFYDLCGLEHQLSAYESVLFDEPNGYRARGQFTNDESKKINQNIETFLFYMSPYALLPQAKAVLEYFIRRYAVNEYDVDTLMKIYLPYHETDLFPKILQISQIEHNSMWSFLYNTKKSKVNLPRTLLSKQCLKDPAFFQFICEIPQNMVEMSVIYKHILSFFVSVIGEAIAVPVKSDKETFLNTFLPYLINGLKCEKCNEYQISCYILLVQLFHSYSLTKSTLKTITKLIIKYMNENSLTMVIQCLIIMYDSQYITKISSKIIKKLIKCSSINEVLKQIHMKYFPNLKNHLPLNNQENDEEEQEEREENDNNKRKVTGEQFISTLLYEVGILKSVQSKMIFTVLNNNNHLLTAIDNIFIDLEGYKKADQENLCIIKSNLYSELLKEPNYDFNNNIRIICPLLNYLLSLIYERGNHKGVKEIIMKFISSFNISLFDGISSDKIDINKENIYEDIFIIIANNIMNKNKPELYRDLLECCNSRTSNWMILILSFYILHNNKKNINIVSNNEYYDFYYVIYQLLSSEINSYEIIEINKEEENTENNNLVRNNNINQKISICFMIFKDLINSIQSSIDYDGEITISTIISYLLAIPNNTIYQLYENEIYNLFTTVLSDNKFDILNSILINPSSQATPQAQIHSFQMYYKLLLNDNNNTISILPLTFISLYHNSKSIRNYSIEIFNELLLHQSNTTATSTAVEATPLRKGRKTPKKTIEKKQQQSSSSSSLQHFIEIILSNKEELINSNKGIKIVCKKIFGDSSTANNNKALLPSNEIEEIFQLLFTSIMNENYLRISYLYSILEDSVFPKSVSEYTIQLLKRIISDCNNESAQINEQQEITEEISTCFKHISNHLFQIKPVTDELFELYLSIIKSIEVNSNISIIIPILLEHFTNEFYLSLSLEQRIDIFNSLFCLLKHNDIISSQLIYTTIGQFKMDLSYIESCFEKLEIIGDNLYEWLNNITVYCEILRNNNEMKNYTPFLSHLFKYLELLLPVILQDNSNNNISNDAAIEYTLQIILENILNYTVYILDVSEKTTSTAQTPSKRRKSNMKDNNIFNIDILLQYLQEKINPQSRNTTLLIIGTLVRGKYDNILKDIYPTLDKMIKLNLSSDIEINYYILLQLLRMIISVIQSKNMTIEYLQLFINNYNIYPENRRLPFFKSVISIFTVSNLYWSQLLFYINIYETQNISENDKNEIISFLHQLSSNFPPLYQVSNLSHLLSISYQILLNYYPNLKDNNNSNSNDIIENEIPNSIKTKYLDKINIVNFITDLLKFVSGHMTSDIFLQQIIGNNEIETNQLEKGYLQICEIIFILIRCIANQCSLPITEQQKQNDSFLPILNSCYDIIDTINELLSIPSFIVVISELLNNSHSIVRKKALLFFNKKIESEENTMTPQEQKLFLEMLSELSKVIQNRNEEIINKQTAILSIHILAEHFADKYKNEFVSSLETIINVIQSEIKTNNNKQLIGSCYICLASLCKSLGTKILKYLSQFFPHLLKLIQHFIKEGSNSNSQKSLSDSSLLLLQSLLSSLSSIIQNIPSFLSPYIKDILISILTPYFIRNSDLINYVQIILKLIGQNIEIRVLYPILDEISEKILSLKDSKCIINLLYLLQKLFEKLSKDDVLYYHKSLFDYLIRFMSYRSFYNNEEEEEDNDEIYETEKSVISTMISFILKLSESQLRPLFLHLCEWFKGDDNNIIEIRTERGIIFYNMLDEITNTLRSIFVPYYGYIFDDIINELELIYNKSKHEKLNKDIYMLLKQIIKCICSCALYDDENKFLDKEKFEVLRSILINTIEINNLPNNENYSDYIDNYIIPCICQVILDINDDIQWKPFHHELLLLTRNSNENIKVASVKVIRECFTRVGEQYLILLSETMPYLSELLEDNNEEVENESLKLKECIEDLSGESIDSYLVS